MRKLTVLILATLFLVLASCETEIPEITPEQTPDIPPEVTDNEEEDRWSVSDFSGELHFYSEEELHEHFQNGGAMRVESEDETRSYDVPTHYYKFKNPPTGVEITHIQIWGSVLVDYNNPNDAEDYGSTFSLRFSPTYSKDIETEGLWTERPFPNESYIREVDGLTYYIRKVDGSIPRIEIFFWSVEWYNSDGYYMHSYFPYDRFTPDEVLEYLSDLERVEIG